MNIIVTVKQVLDPNLPPSYVSVAEDGRKIVAPPGIAPVMNGYDANALEAALRLREAHGGRVTAVCLGDETSRGTLKRALAMGADAVVLLGDPQWHDLDSRGVARVLGAAIRKTGPFDLVLCGRQASDTDAGQVLYWLAEALEVPIVSPVSNIETVAEGHLVVHRLMEDGFQRIRVGLPAVIGVSSELNEPRAPSLKGTMAAARAMIASWSAADLGVERPHPKVELRRLELQARTSSARLIDGETAAAAGAALADQLHEEGLL
jgi:electron transfer flavoprotein beta subunit